MYYINYNDYELLYLYKEGIEKAYELLDKKYYSLIIKTARSFRVKESVFEDVLEDGRIKLLEAINKYKLSYGMTFYNYFLMILTRMLVAYYKSGSYNAIKLEVPLIGEAVNLYDGKEDILPRIIHLSKMINFKDDIAKAIFNECIIEGLSIKGFSVKYNKEYTKIRYKYNYLLNEIKKILTIG